MSTFKLFVASDGRVDALKCLAVAALTKASVEPVPMTSSEPS